MNSKADLIERVEHHLKHYWGNSEAERDVKNALALLKRYREGLERVANTEFEVNQSDMNPDMTLSDKFQAGELWRRIEHAKQILGGSDE